MRRVVDVVTVLFWASVALLAARVMLSWVAPGVRDEQSFLYLGAALLVLAMVFSAFLFWQELRAGRRELRAIRRQNRAIRVEEGGANGPPRRGSTPRSSSSPSSSRGTCCLLCSCPEPKPPVFEGKRRPVPERGTLGDAYLLSRVCGRDVLRTRPGRLLGSPHSLGSLP
jgi:hypothetical protein